MVMAEKQKSGKSTTWTRLEDVGSSGIALGRYILTGQPSRVLKVLLSAKPAKKTNVSLKIHKVKSRLGHRYLMVNMKGRLDLAHRKLELVADRAEEKADKEDAVALEALAVLDANTAYGLLEAPPEPNTKLQALLTLR
jgi:hypothetical protein